MHDSPAPEPTHLGIHLTFDFRYDPSGVAGTPAEMGQWVLAVSRAPIERAGLRIVGSTMHVYDGSVSPPGFSAVHVLDSSSFTVHAYCDRGLIAAELFSCIGERSTADSTREAMREISEAMVARFKIRPEDAERCERLRFPTFR